MRRMSLVIAAMLTVVVRPDAVRSQQDPAGYGAYNRGTNAIYGHGTFNNRFGYGTRFGYADRYGNNSGFVSRFGFGTRYGLTDRFGHVPYDYHPQPVGEALGPMPPDYFSRYNPYAGGLVPSVAPREAGPAPAPQPAYGAYYTTPYAAWPKPNAPGQEPGAAAGAGQGPATQP